MSTGATLSAAAAAPSRMSEGSSGDTLDNGGGGVGNFATLFILQFLALVPMLFKKRLAAFEERAF